MKSPFFSLLTPPEYAEYETNLKARLVFTSLLVSAPATLFLVLFNFSVNSSALTGLMGLLCVYSFATLIFFKKIPFSITALGLCTLLWVAMTYNLFDGAALHDQGVAAFPILILFAGFMFDWQWAVILTATFSILSITGVYASSAMNFPWFYSKYQPSLIRYITLVILYGAFGLEAHVIKTAWKKMLANLRAAYESSLREIVERKRVEAEIQALNASLEQRVAERTHSLEQVNRELESFTYSVSHDLRSPLRAIKGYSQVMIEDYNESLPEEGRNILSRIESNTNKMGFLIDDLLMLSRLGRQAVHKQRLQPGPLIKEVIEEMKADLDGRRVVIKIEDLPDCNADPALLKQVWVNLLSNAVKYTRQRDAAQIAVGSKQDDQAATVYFIQDNGVGFDMRYADKLFGVFQRMHSSEAFEGTGVGLAIVNSIIQHHGGRIWAEAEVDRGCTFFFTLD